jgi:hypothetical protein
MDAEHPPDERRLPLERKEPAQSLRQLVTRAEAILQKARALRAQLEEKLRQFLDEQG